MTTITKNNFETLTAKSKYSLINAIETHLDTRDKRYMFLKLMFRELSSNIEIDGSSHNAALNIYCEFKKQNMLGSLMACFNTYLDTDLYLEFDNN